MSKTQNVTLIDRSDYSERSGVSVRDDLSLFIWREDEGLEVLLTPAQAIGLGLKLFESVQAALLRAEQQGAATCKN